MTWQCPNCGASGLGEGHAPTCPTKGYPFDVMPSATPRKQLTKADIEDAAASLFITTEQGVRIAYLAKVDVVYRNSGHLPIYEGQEVLSLPEVVSILCKHLGVPE